MSSVKDKVDALLEKLAQRDICADEANAVRLGARHYDQAERSRGTAVKNEAAAGVTSVGGAIGGVLCGVAVGTANPVAAAACLIGAATGIFGGGLWGDAAAEDAEIAEDQMADALDELNGALDKLCACVSSHQQSHPTP